MTDHEILMELLEEKRRSEKQRKIQLIITIVIAAALVIALIYVNVQVSASIRQVQTNLEMVNTATQEITGFFDGLKSAGYENAEDALKDLCTGMLPLGGGVNRGNGCFEGEIKRNGELIYENN